MFNYKKFIETRLKIIDKSGEVKPFIVNSIQEKILNTKELRRIEVKARQQGVSSINLAKRVPKFILMPNKYILTIADNADNAQGLLQRVKFFINSYEEIAQTKIPLKYNSTYRLFNESNNSWWEIGTAENVDVGRSKTVTDLILSEAAFFKDLQKLLASALQSVVPDGEVDIETTANGFNELKTIWDEAVLGINGFEPLFFKASDFYAPDFLEKKKKELGRYYSQEYPETAEEAFLTSGDLYFDSNSLKLYLEEKKPVMDEGVIYA
jgi:hypothetical protein